MGVERWLYRAAQLRQLGAGRRHCVYSAVSWSLGCHGPVGAMPVFSEIVRLAWVCLGAGLASAVVVLMAQLVEVPRPFLALHPVFALITMTLARMSIRLLNDHARQRRGQRCQSPARPGPGGRCGKKLLIAGIQHRGWSVVGLLDDDVRKAPASLA